MKRKVIKAWAILKGKNIAMCCESYRQDTLCIHTIKITEKALPCTITYELPRKARKAK